MARFFHISDLHFDKEIVPNQPFLPGLHGHNIEIWGIFRKHFFDRLETIEDAYLVFITGDLSAQGNIDSLRLAKQLIIKDTKSDLSKELGLQLSDQNVIIIPGNHDSYESRLVGPNKLRLFKEIFQVNEDYPITRLVPLNSKAIAVIGFESTYLNNAYTPAKKLGRGVIEKQQYKIAEAFLRDREVDFRLVCLHHNPIFPPNIKKDWNLVLERSKEFLDWIIKNKIDMVLFGHIHDDFYDILPLKSLLRLLPKKRGIGPKLRRMYLKTNTLMDYSPITINGEYMRQMDAIAYQYIKNRRTEILKPKEFNSKKQFEEYLYSLPEYDEFMVEINRFSKQETMMIMTGSVCQHNDARKNSYIEIEIPEEDSKIKIHRHKYNPKRLSFVTKSKEIPIVI